MAAPALPPIERHPIEPVWPRPSLPLASEMEGNARLLWQAASLARLCLRVGWSGHARAALQALGHIETSSIALRAQIRATERDLLAALTVAEAVAPIELA